jgi:hypothetical protein
MNFKTVSAARAQNLIQFTTWQMNTPDERKSLESSRNQIMKNPLRKVMFVQGSDFRIALFVDNVAKSGDTARGPRTQQISTSGKYKSIRHLAEVLFAKNPDLTIEQWKKAMMKEYPKSESAGIKCYGHYCWYRHHLALQGRFRYIERPSWFQVKIS